MKPVAIYVRISTDKQDTASQVNALKKLAEKEGWKDPTWYVDEGHSGRKGSRPQLDLMLESVKHGRHDIVAAFKLDRIGRSVQHLVELVRFLDSKKVSLVFVRDKIDTGTAAGRLFFHVLCAMAQFESDLISERTSAGLQAKKQAGARLGKKPEVDSAIVVRLRQSGMSSKFIGEKLGCTARQVQRLCKRAREASGV